MMPGQQKTRVYRSELRAPARRQEIQAGSGVSQCTGDVNQVPDTRGAAQQGLARFHDTGERNVEKETGFGCGRIPADEAHVIGRARLRHASVELLNLRLRAGGRDRNGDQHEPWRAAHRGDVAEIGDGGPVADVSK